MRRLAIRCLFFTGLCVIGAVTAVAIKSPEALKEREFRRRMERLGAYERAKLRHDATAVFPADGPQTAVSGLSVVDDWRTAASLLGTLAADTIASPGLEVGVTSYDLQHNEGQGHQIGRDPGANTVHIGWMYWDRLPTNIDDQDRFASYNSYDISQAKFNQGFNGNLVSLGDFARAGFTRLDVGSDNNAHMFFHQRSITNSPYTIWELEFPLVGGALHLDDELSTGGLGELLWADGAVAQKPSGDVHHVLGHDGNLETRNLLTYWRYDEGAASPTWQGPVIIDSTNILGYVIDADNQSNDVAIAYHSEWATDGFNSRRNVVYRESTTGGAGWISGAELGPASRTFVTTYSDLEGPEAWVHISTAYDHAGVLHIVYDEQRIARISEDIAIKHWSDSRGNSRTVTLGYYENPGVQFFNLNLSKVTLGIGDGSTLCQGGAVDNTDYLYVVYTKLCGETQEESFDVSALGWCNGEIYLVGSNTSGDTWSPPQNLTNTRLPGCRPDVPDSVCPSEHWATIGRDVSDIDIFYIRDFDAGAIPFEEGTWTMNRAMYLRLPGGTTDADYVCPLIAPSMSVFLTYDPECEYHANPGATNTETLTLFNLGNAALTGQVSVTQGASWLSVSGAGPYTLAAGSPEQVMTVTMGPETTEDLYVGNIRLTHNDTSKPSPIDFPIEFFVVDGFKCPQNDLLRTGVASPGVLSLQVGSAGRLAFQNDFSGLWRFIDSSSSLYDGSLVIAHGTQSVDTIAFHRFYEREDPGQRGFRPLSDLTIDTSAYSTGSGYATASAMLTTADSVIGVLMEWFFPQDPVYSDFVIGRYTVSNRTTNPIDSVVVGLWLDFDVQAALHSIDLQDGLGNHGNFVQALNLIYQYGFDTVGHIPATHLNSTERYSGGVSYIKGRGADGAAFDRTLAPMRGGVDDNRHNQLGGGPSSGRLYSTLVGAPGVTVWAPIPHADSAKDEYTWLTLDQDRTLAANGASPEVYVVALVTDTLEHANYPLAAKSVGGGLPVVVDSAWAWAERHVLCYCPVHADPLPDGKIDILDVVYTINVAFKGFPEMWDEGCPVQRTDVNCSGASDILDVVFTINVAFKGFPEETTFCNPCQ